MYINVVKIYAKNSKVNTFAKKKKKRKKERERECGTFLNIEAVM
jgi:hypothetical protein